MTYDDNQTMTSSRGGVILLKILILSLIFCSPALAYKNHASYLGIGYYSQNALNKTTTSSTSSPSILGAASYPVNFKYDWALGADWFFSPQLSYTLFPRTSAGGSAKVTILHLLLPFGMNIGGGSSGWDWFVGPGLIRYAISGSGGATTLNNGTSTATFAVPGDSVVMQNFTINTGGSFSSGSSRYGLDLIFEALLSSGKRTENFMLSYAYRFGGGGF